MTSDPDDLTLEKYLISLSLDDKDLLTRNGIPQTVDELLSMNYNELYELKLSIIENNNGSSLTEEEKLRIDELTEQIDKLRLDEIIFQEAKENSWYGSRNNGKKKKSTTAAAAASKTTVNKESNKEKKVKEYYLQKYDGAEAVLIGDGRTPVFLQIINGNPVLSLSIIFPDMVLNPPDRLSYLSKEYSFGSEEEIKSYVKRAENENLDSLYLKVKSIWKKYIDADDSHISLCAADTIFTYFQDKLGMTHYILFVGDNDTGKSNNLTVFQYLAYRPLFDTSITPANIYSFLGSIEEGQGIILEDEVDNIDQLQEKMKIYKVGYKSGVKVSRMDTSIGRSQQSYWTYGFKAFTAEQQPDSLKGKGFNERLFVIKCSPGNPNYDIIEVINNAGDEKYKSLFDELLDVRKLLLIYRLLHHNDPIHDISLNIKNRDKQLCKPLIRLFKDTKSVADILSSLSKLLKEKKKRKGDTLEAKLHHIINDLVKANKAVSLDPDKITLESATIWDTVKKELEGEEIPNKPRSYDTSEYGLISLIKVVHILEDRFGGERGRNEKARTILFSKAKLDKLSGNYSFIDKIEIMTTNNGQICHAQNNPICHAQNDISDILGSNMSRSNDILPNIMPNTSVFQKHNFYWLEGSGKYHCRNCKKSGDRFLMEETNCEGRR